MATNLAWSLVWVLDLSGLTEGASVVHYQFVGGRRTRQICGCSSVVEHLLAKERVESSNLFIRLNRFLFHRPALGVDLIIFVALRWAQGNSAAFKNASFSFYDAFLAN